MWHGFVITMQFLVISFCLPLQLTLRGKRITQSHRTTIYYVDLTLRDGVNLQDAIVTAKHINEQSLVNKTFKYSYDANSNRLTRNQTENGSTTENYTVQANNNRINTITQGSSSKTYSYLPSGQITSDGNRSYSYNAQGRSESINTGQVAALIFTMPLDSVFRKLEAI